MLRPPAFGTGQVRLTVPVLGVAVGAGVAIVPSGVPTTVLLSGPSPTTFTPTTLNSYAVPFVSPVTFLFKVVGPLISIRVHDPLPTGR